MRKKRERKKDHLRRVRDRLERPSHILRMSVQRITAHT
jgi:hypothetical protein